MLLPKEPVTRPRLVHAARFLLDWLAGIYIERALTADGQKIKVAMPDGIIEPAFRSWAEVLGDAPAKLVEPKALRAVIEEAIAEAQMRQTDRFAPRFGRSHAVEMLRGFGESVDRARFASPRGLRFRPWLYGALRLPPVPATGPTEDDLHLRARIDALTADERAGTTEFSVDETETLRDLSPLSELPSLTKLALRSAHLLTDLSPLKTLTRLANLLVEATEPPDLSPLASLPHLRCLHVSADERLDLGPLRSLTELEELAVSGCEDLSPIEGFHSLRKLDLSGYNVQPRLESIRKLVGLRQLELHGIKGEPTDVLRPLRSLVHLQLYSCEALSDVSVLGQLTELEYLDLGMSPVTDLSPLKLPKLRFLRLFGTSIRSWPPLRDLPCLEELNVMCTPLGGLAGVEGGLALRKLEVGPTGVRAFADLRPLSGLTRLETLHLDSFEHLSDLSPLQSLTRLRVLDAGDSAVRDATPLARMTSLEHLTLARTAIESVAPLAGLPNLRFLSVEQCRELRSIRPLAACPKLEEIDCSECDLLVGPKSVSELRAPVPEPRQAKQFPSAGPALHRAGAVTAFDARAHLPKRPPEGWSLPEREHDDEDVFWIEAEHSARIMMALVERNEAHVLSLHIWRHDRTRMPDKQAARILRRFRAADAFVENDDTMLDEAPDVRLFVARAHAASPDTWGAHRVKGALIRVEEPTDGPEEDPSGPEADVRHHLPSPLPAGWSVRATAKEPEDVACLLSAPEAAMTASIRAAEASDLRELVVSLMPTGQGVARTVSDDTARGLLGHFRRRGAFAETSAGPIARAPGMRIFIAPVKMGARREPASSN
jgi:Leucine-rich repeat (LRR) protein